MTGYQVFGCDNDFVCVVMHSHFVLIPFGPIPFGPILFGPIPFGLPLTKCEKVPFGPTFAHVTLDHTWNTNSARNK